MAGDGAFARLLIVLGLGLAAAGAVYLYRDKVPILKHIGNLPGDFHFRSGHTTIHVPIVTCIVLSVVLSLVFRLFRG